MRIKTLQELNLEDDFLFARVMANETVAIELLEKILDIKIEKIVTLEEQKNIDLSLNSKSVRLDVYLKDQQNTVYNVEIQRGTYRNLPKRSRYYQGSIDLNLITKGMDYNNLPQSFLIFICTFDFFGKGRYRYTFRHRCIEDPSLTFGDETQIVLLNSKGKGDDVNEELREFLHYIENSSDNVAEQAKGMLVKHIHSAVTAVKASKKTEVNYMTLYELEEEIRARATTEGKAEGKAEGRAEGRVEGKAESIIELLHRFGHIPSELERRISQECDSNQLTEWLLLAAKAENTKEFLEESNMLSCM